VIRGKRSLSSQNCVLGACSLGVKLPVGEDEHALRYKTNDKK
jgi:hypothetical protein